MAFTFGWCLLTLAPALLRCSSTLCKSKKQERMKNKTNGNAEKVLQSHSHTPNKDTRPLSQPFW